MNAIVDFPSPTTLDSYKQIDLEFDAELKTLFSWMKLAPRACLNPAFVDEVERLSGNSNHTRDGSMSAASRSASIMLSSEAAHRASSA